MGAKHSTPQPEQTRPAEPAAPSADVPPQEYPGIPAVKTLKELRLEELPNESQLPVAYTVYDVFFWRDVPDWYFKTFTSAGFAFSYFALRQYVNRHEIEVFMPPRARILPASMQKGYRNTQVFKHALMKVGLQTLGATAVSGVYFAGAYYLGRHREKHEWKNFVASGTLAGALASLAIAYPPRPRLFLACTALGALAGCPMYAIQASGVPFWDETHDFVGWWWGRYVDNITARKKEEAAKLGAASSSLDGSSGSSQGSTLKAS